jgi:phosphoenolpyruvate synthase/pyruvate phosphate dikinase
LERALQDALKSDDLAGVESRFVADVKRLRSLAGKARFVVERVPAPETLTLALKESLEKAA